MWRSRPPRSPKTAANGTVVGALSSTDPDAGDSFTYTLLDNAGGRFALSGSNLVVANSGLLNFEAATSHNVQVRVTDSAGNTFTKTLTVGVSNVNEAPTNVALSTSSVAENAANGTVVGALSSTDPDAGDSFTYTLLDNAGGRFALSGSNLVVANSGLLNFEAATSHNVQVRVTDSAGNTFTKTLTVGVSNVNEAPTQRRRSRPRPLPRTPPTARSSAPCRRPIRTRATASPTRCSTMPAAALRFGSNLVVANSGLLNFEAATSHNVQVRVTDSAGNTFTKTLTVGVSDVVEGQPNGAPTTHLDLVRCRKLRQRYGRRHPVVDRPGCRRQLHLHALDNAGGRFALSGSNLVVANSGLLNFEAATSHNVQVRVTDSAGNTFTKTLTVGVSNVNEAPTNVALSTSTVAENSANGTVVGALSSTDPDAGDSFTYTLLDNAGGRFALSGSNLVVANSGLLNFEAATSHNVQVRVTDSAGNTFTKTLTVGVSNVNEAPTNVALSTSSVAENTANGTVVGALSSTDPDAGDSFTYTLLDNAGGRFALSGSNLVVANSGLLNFEAATSHNVQVRVTDSAGNTFTKTLTVGVSNVNEAPTNVALSTSSVAENCCQRHRRRRPLVDRPGCRRQLHLHAARQCRRPVCPLRLQPRRRQQRPAELRGRDQPQCPGPGHRLGREHLHQDPHGRCQQRQRGAHQRGAVDLLGCRELPPTARSWAPCRRPTRMPATASPTRCSTMPAAGLPSPAPTWSSPTAAC